MSKSSKSKSKASSVKVVSSVQPDSRLTRSNMPFTSTPLYSSMEKVQPKVTPNNRRLVPGGAVKVVGKIPTPYI